MNFKVKGTGVTIFTEKDITFINQYGNDKGREVWLGKFNSKHDRLPDPKKYDDVKQHIIQKYKNKKYYLSVDDKKGSDGDDDEDDNSSDEEKKEKKSKKEKEKKSKNNSKVIEEQNNNTNINANKNKLRP